MRIEGSRPASLDGGGGRLGLGSPSRGPLLTRLRGERLRCTRTETAGEIGDAVETVLRFTPALRDVPLALRQRVAPVQRPRLLKSSQPRLAESSMAVLVAGNQAGPSTSPGARAEAKLTGVSEATIWRNLRSSRERSVTMIANAACAAVP
jgi:hypothetical protein